MKRKGLLLILLTLVCLVCLGTSTVNAATTTFKKVTSLAEVEEGGSFLIVYQSSDSEGVCFNSSLSSLDAASNNYSISINNDVISADSKYAFTISGSGSSFTIKSSSGYYIGNTADSNKINSSTSTKYTNTITIESDGSAKIVGSGKSVLRYNANTSNYRFRYFKSTTYTSQQKIYLYKQYENSGDDVVQLTKLETPAITCKDNQTGAYTWSSVNGAIGYSYTIGNESFESTVPTTVTLEDGQTLTVTAKGDNETTENSDTASVKYDAPANIKVKNLVGNFYFDGSYVRETEIYLNAAAQEELIECFHAQVNMLTRTTYFKPTELWMTNEVGTYSYYGTSGNHMTGGRVSELGETVDTIALKDVKGMEGYYTTLTDIKDSVEYAEWNLVDGAYVSTDKDIIKLFLDFTAPCFYGLEGSKYANYFTLSGVSVKDNSGVLELRLLTSGDDGKITSSDKALSLAKISKYTEKASGTLEENAKITFNNTSKRTALSTTQQIWEENGLVITNTKGASTTDVADYANPARFYKNSDLTIECSKGAFNKITVSCVSNEHATAFANSINKVDGVTATASSTTVTVIFDEAVYSVSFSLTEGQARVNSIECEYAE